MIAALLLSSSMALGAAPAPSAPADSIRDLYGGGRPFAEFLEATRSRRDQWHDHYRDAHVPDSLLLRARGVGGTWHILAVAEDWCGDSANTIPYLARLVDQVDGLDIRVVDSRTGRWVMEAHRTADGRPATPTVLLLDADWREVGSLVERPAPLAAWVEAHRQEMSDEELHRRIYDWYDRDGGASAVAEIVGMMESASPPGPTTTLMGSPAPPLRVAKRSGRVLDRPACG